MEITVNIKVNLEDLDIWQINQIGLVNSSQGLVKIARENAPYDTWTLKKGIGVEANGSFTTNDDNLKSIITKSTKEARVWPRKIIYSIRREFENKKNPGKKFYMKRTYEVAESVVKKEFQKAVDIVISNL